jgi:hypothetical protein
MTKAAVRPPLGVPLLINFYQVTRHKVLFILRCPYYYPSNWTKKNRFDSNWSVFGCGCGSSPELEPTGHLLTCPNLCRGSCSYVFLD